MPIINNTLLAGAAGQGGGYTIDQSIRFNRDDSAYLTRTPSSASDRRTFTLSFWWKMCTIPSTTGGGYRIIAAGSTEFGWSDTNDSMYLNDGLVLRATNQVFRDVSAWQHIVIAADTTSGTADDRLKLYINGEQVTSWRTNNTISQNFDFDINNTVAQNIGKEGANYIGAYVAEFHSVDGTQLAPTDFGEYNDDGVWIPKAYEGTYGTNGFYITGANSADLGADESGNGNDFTSSGLTASDQVSDSPTDNYAIINLLTASNTTMSFHDGNLKVEMNNAYPGNVLGSIGVSTGKYYWEVTMSGTGSSANGYSTGVAVAGWANKNTDPETVSTPYAHYIDSRSVFVNNGTTTGNSTTFTAGDIIGVALDCDNDEITFYKNNTIVGSAQSLDADQTWFPLFKNSTGVADLQYNPDFGQLGYTYTPPTGFSALSTANLPTQTIADGSKYFNSYLWTGNGGGQRIASFQPITETYTIDNSARFNFDDSPRLTKTLGTATDNTAYTVSFWLKRGKLGTAQYIFSGGTSGTSTEDFWRFETSNKMGFRWAGTDRLITTQEFEDASTWYHLVLAVDFNASGSDKAKLYVNGAEVTAFDTDSRSSLSVTNVKWNQAENHTISGFLTTGASYFDGYLSDFNFIDGQQLTPSSFGQTDTSTNRWVPKAYSGSYGNNGFFLEFGDSAALGDDTSGNTNDFTSSGLTADDQMTDTPTQNYATMNPNATQGGSSTGPSGVTFSEGNLQVTNISGETSIATFGVNSGKWYWEVDVVADQPGLVIGAVNQYFNIDAEIGYNSPASQTGAKVFAIYGGTGNLITTISSSSSGSAYGSAINVNDVIGVALNLDDSEVTFYINGVSQGAASIPALGKGEYYTPAVGNWSAATITAAFNFGQSSFTHTPPTGYKKINTDNLPLTGGNISAFSWIKSRSTTYNHQIYDRVRGPEEYLSSNTLTAETTDTNGLQTFLLDGFQLGSSSNVNASGQTYVGWNWMTDTSGSGSSNTDGSITSTVLADTTVGFSIVGYTGNGTNGATVGHGLSQRPEFIIVKRRSGAIENWRTQDIFNTATDYMNLSGTAASVASAGQWNNTEPTSSVFTLGTDTAVNASGSPYISYLFHSVEGFSKIGKYTGNGSADGTFVWCGFRPAWLMVKRTDSTGYWPMWDTSRETYNQMGNQLYADLTNAEASNDYNLDILSNGFKLRDTSYVTNGSGGTYIFMAFAEHPFGGDNVSPVPAR